jgi:putative transposase
MIASKVPAPPMLNLPSADTATMPFWALLAYGQINMRKIDRWQTLTTKVVDQPIDLAA